jgi:hypothetical protein
MSRTRTVVSMFVGVAAPVWGLAPIASLLPMSPSFPERWYSMHVWSWMAILWASSFLVLFAGLTWLGERAAPFISVICTVSFGLPAIALGPFPNLTRPPLTEARLDLTHLDDPRLTNSQPVIYIVGIDVSQSFWPGHDPQVREALRRIFKDTGPAGAAMRADLGVRVQDRFEVEVFADGLNQVFPDGIEGGELSHHGRLDLLQRLNDPAFLGAHPGVSTGNTDVLAFISAAVSNLVVGRPACAVRLIVFSDFMQSPGIEGPGLAKRLAEVKALTSTVPDFALVAFHAPPSPGSSEKKADKDVLTPLRESLDEGRVQDVDLQTYIAAKSEAEQAMIPYSLVPFSQALTRCELAAPGPEHLDRSKVLLALPREFETVYVGLYSDTGEPLNVRILDCDGAVGGWGTLAPERGGASFCKLERRSGSPDQVVLEVGSRSPSASEAHGLLRFIVPAHNQLASTELNVSRVDNSGKYLTFSYVLLILNGVPLVISGLILKHLVRGQPAGAQQTAINRVGGI